MAAYKHTLVAMMAVVCAICIQTGSAITCYSCTSDGSTTDTNSCGASPASNPLSSATISQITLLNGTVTDCAYCTTTVNGQGSFSRGCLMSSPSNAALFQTGCTSSLGVGTCYCNSDRCNTKAVQYGRGSLSCYVCSSLDFFDNGCGATLDSSSIYVKTMTGCTACSKSVRKSNGGGSYSRGCLYTTSSSNTCAGTIGVGDCDNRCESNLCNTATTTTTTRYPIILAVIGAVYGVLLF